MLKWRKGHVEMKAGRRYCFCFYGLRNTSKSKLFDQPELQTNYKLQSLGGARSEIQKKYKNLVSMFDPYLIVYISK